MRNMMASQLNSIPRRIEQLDTTLAVDQLLHLTNSRIVCVFAEQIERDFPIFTGLGVSDATEKKSLISDWLLANGALVSESQTKQHVVTSDIPAAGPAIAGYRPPRYERSAIVSVRGSVNVASGQTDSDLPECPGLFDVKGVGVRAGVVTTLTNHGTGLFMLADIFNELVNQMLVSRILRHAGVRITTLPVYAVIDAGFDCRDWRTPDGALRPVGLLIRQAHRRIPNGNDLPNRGSVRQLVYAKIEMLLRHYGVTSSKGSQLELAERNDGNIELRSEEGKLHIDPQTQLRTLYELSGGEGRVQLDGINIQTAREVFDSPARATLVDFGHYGVNSFFQNPIVSSVCDRPFRWGGLLSPQDRSFVQPDPRLAVRLENWKWNVLDEETARRLRFPFGDRLSKVQELSLDLAMRWRAETISGDAIMDRLIDHVDEATCHWPLWKPCDRTDLF